MTYRESTEGDEEVRLGRHTVESSIQFGSTTSNTLDLPTDGIHHVSGEVEIEVSGAGSDWPWPARVHRQIEAAVADVLDDVAARVEEDDES